MIDESQRHHARLGLGAEGNDLHRLRQVAAALEPRSLSTEARFMMESAEARLVASTTEMRRADEARHASEARFAADTRIAADATIAARTSYDALRGRLRT